MSSMSTAVVLVNLSVNLLLKGGFISCLGHYSPHAGADLLTYLTQRLFSYFLDLLLPFFSLSEAKVP